MKRLIPKCDEKCDKCFFYFIDECIVLPNEDNFIEINEKQAELILNNKNRFLLSKEKFQKLMRKFPDIKKHVNAVSASP